MVGIANTSTHKGTRMVPQRPKKILIVEDEHDIAQLVRHYLEKEGFHPNIATTGLEALNLAASEHPDLVILDLMLPQMDGLEVCKTLRHKPETALLPIIMLTAKKEESDTVVGLELGADDYVTKPFSPKTLVTRVKSLFRRLEQTIDQKPTSLVYGSFKMDLARHEVTMTGVKTEIGCPQNTDVRCPLFTDEIVQSLGLDRHIRSTLPEFGGRSATKETSLLFFP